MWVKFLAQGNNSNTKVATPGIEPTTFRSVGQCPDHLPKLAHTQQQHTAHIHTHNNIQHTYTHNNIQHTYTHDNNIQHTYTHNNIQHTHTHTQQHTAHIHTQQQHTAHTHTHKAKQKPKSKAKPTAASLKFFPYCIDIHFIFMWQLIVPSLLVLSIWSCHCPFSKYTQTPQACICSYKFYIAYIAIYLLWCYMC